MIPAGDPRADEQKPHEILLINGPIHYDFLIPLAPRSRTAFEKLIPHHPALSDENAEWLLIGWGAREFYTTVGSYRDLSAGAIWRGITGDSAVMRVDVLGPIDPDFPTRGISLSDQAFDIFLTEITKTFADWTPLPAQGFGETDRFYPARGTFHIARTCNVWIGKSLRAAGVRFGIWTPLPASVTLSHWLYGSS